MATRLGLAAALLFVLVPMASAGGGRHPYFNDQGTLVWYERFADAQRAARAEGKVIFVEYGRLHCGQCRVLVQSVLPQVRDRLSKIAVGLAADCDAPEPAVDAILRRNLPDAQMLPFAGFLTADGRWICGFSGTCSPTFLSQQMAQADACLARARAAAKPRAPARPPVEHATPPKTPLERCTKAPAPKVEAPCAEPAPAVAKAPPAPKVEAPRTEQAPALAKATPAATPPPSAPSPSAPSPSALGAPVVASEPIVVPPPAPDPATPAVPAPAGPALAQAPVAPVPTPLPTPPPTPPPTPVASPAPPVVAEVSPRESSPARPPPVVAQVPVEPAPAPREVVAARPSFPAVVGARPTGPSPRAALADTGTRLVGSPDGDLPKPTIRISRPVHVGDVAVGSPSGRSDLPNAERAAREGRWGDVLRIADAAEETSGDAARRYAELSMRAHEWAHERLAFAFGAAREGRTDDAIAALRLVQRQMRGEPEAEDADRGETAVHRMAELRYLHPSGPVYAALVKSTREEMRGSQWEPLFR